MNFENLQSTLSFSKKRLKTAFFTTIAALISTILSGQALALEKGLLFVYPEPTDADVRVLEVEDEYLPGMPLEPGAYEIRIEKAGYEAYRKKIYIEPEEIYDLFVELKKSDLLTERETGMEFVRVPGGCFQMGCENWAGECGPDEVPAREVCVEDFWLGKHEVTQGAWKKIMGENPSRFAKGEDYPVEHVTWSEAREFVAKLTPPDGFTARLPTEAEWEYAARSGGLNQVYAGGNDISPFGWYSENSLGGTHPVGEKKANGFGIHDMSGNVWEWCLDVYKDDLIGMEPDNEPVDSARALFRVRRGGSWSCGKENLRSVFRGRYPPELRFESNGFRVLLEPSRKQSTRFD